MSAAQADDGLVQVVLRDFPVRLHERAEEHHRELMREFAHIAHSDATAGDRVPERLLALVAALEAEYAPLAGPPRMRIEEARAEGRDAIDVNYPVPVGVLDAVDRLAKELDEADEFCRSGELLTLASPADVVRFRRWFFSEFRRQIAGEPPLPWPGPPD